MCFRFTKYKSVRVKNIFKLSFTSLFLINNKQEYLLPVGGKMQKICNG